MHSILIIDDEQSILDVVSEMLGEEKYMIFQARDGEKGLEIIKSNSVDLVLCDMKMSPLSGLEVLKKAKQQGSQAVYIIMTAYGSIENAVECMRSGAYDYITKPVRMDELRLVVARALEHKGLVQENILLKKQLQEKYSFENIIGKSNSMQKVYELMEKVSQTDSTVLIYGESGTGKELVAKAIHQHSPRNGKPFVAINCGGLPEGLLESELFGHVKGAFTGSVSDKVGLFQVADKGTIFLDEISATSPAIQVKLLRVIQEKEIKRVGDTRDIPVDVRVIAATNRLLEEEIKKGTFREDLYYRLSVIPIHLPPLRERMDDIPLLVQHFIEKHSGVGKRNLKTLEQGVVSILLNYNWPGNVRELENIIERAITLCEGTVIVPKDLPESILKSLELTTGTGSKVLKDVMSQKEKEYIKIIIEEVKGDKKAAAEKLGIDLATLYRKLQK
jgi:DNA-binding NtrC family response regulator